MDILRQKRVTFVQGLTSIPSVLDHLLSNNVITMSNKNDIETHRNPEHQARALIDLLFRKGPRVLEGFYDALVKTDNGPLAELLEGAVTKTSVQEENRPQPIQPKPKPKIRKQEKHCQLLVLEGEYELEGFKKKNDIFTIENCTRILEKIKESFNKNPDLKKFAVFILDSFHGNAVETMTSSVPISEIYSTLMEKIPEKEIICVLLHSEDTKNSPGSLDKDPFQSCRLAVLSKGRLEKFLEEDFESNDQCFSRLTEFIHPQEIIWPFVNGFICLFDGLEDNKEIGDFLREEETRMNFKSVSGKCSDIESELKKVPVLPDAKYFIVFLLGQFNGKEVEDISNEDKGVHITKICVTMKDIWPKIPKICVLLQADDVKPERVGGLERGDESVLIVSLTKLRLTKLIKEMKNSNINSCIQNFVKEEEKIW